MSAAERFERRDALTLGTIAMDDARANVDALELFR
jgi:hypothetical protein